ncbi:MAG: 50S ribosomal protein L29 [candidate division WOR-3 bacterium]
MKAKDLRELTLDELNKRLRELKEELFTLRMDKALHRLNQPHKFREIKREIARVLTVMNEKKGGNNAQ